MWYIVTTMVHFVCMYHRQYTGNNQPVSSTIFNQFHVCTSFHLMHVVDMLYTISNVMCVYSFTLKYMVHILDLFLWSTIFADWWQVRSRTKATEFSLVWWHHEFEKFLKRQLDWCYLQSITLQCLQKTRGHDYSPVYHDTSDNCHQYFKLVPLVPDALCLRLTDRQKTFLL